MSALNNLHPVYTFLGYGIYKDIFYIEKSLTKDYSTLNENVRNKVQQVIDFYARNTEYLSCHH